MIIIHLIESFLFIINGMNLNDVIVMNQICDDGDPERSHPISNAIDGTHRWWQSPTLQNGRQFEWVTITIDLKQVPIHPFNSSETALKLLQKLMLKSSESALKVL